MTETKDLVGQVVEDRYRIEAELGAGGMGAVYRARHIKVGREVAIKVLHDHLVQDPLMVERFEREAAIAARLNHKNLNAVIDVGETATKQKLMVLELVRGENLATIIGHGPLAPARVMHLTAQILDGLEHAHDAGLVHRDLKPENIIVECDTGGEVPKIVDFGIAMLRDESSQHRLTAAGHVLGTPQYMAPEHAQGREVDQRCDLFALGVIVFEMLAGRLPFDGVGVDVAIANITKDPPAIAARTPGVVVDPLLEAFVRRLMARKRNDRFQSARAARDVLGLIENQPRVARGTDSPVALSPACEPPALTDEPDGFAATLEAPKPMATPAPCRPKRPRPRRTRPGKPSKWTPWKSLGLLAGAVLAAITVTIASLTTPLAILAPAIAKARDLPK